MTTNNLDKKHEPRTTRTTRTQRNRPIQTFAVSIITDTPFFGGERENSLFVENLQRTLPLNFMNREQRGGYGQGGLQGTLPFFVRGFRVFRG